MMMSSHDESAALELLNMKHEQPSHVEVRAASSLLSSLLMQQHQQQQHTTPRARGVASSAPSFMPRNASSKLVLDPSIVPSTKGSKGKGKGRRWIKNAPLIPDYKRTGGAPRSSTIISIVGASSTNKKSKGRRWINASLIPDYSRAAPQSSSSAVCVSNVTSLPAPVAMGKTGKDLTHLSPVQVYLREHCCEFFEAG